MDGKSTCSRSRAVPPHSRREQAEVRRLETPVAPVEGSEVRGGDCFRCLLLEWRGSVVGVRGGRLAGKAEGPEVNMGCLYKDWSRGEGGGGGSANGSGCREKPVRSNVNQ
uniref:Uncharacterized protein n=1 Tax=Knipowitschia caucasica TaxID=637954 RepID=A0AAV2JL57_KNICA